MSNNDAKVRLSGADPVARAAAAAAVGLSAAPGEDVIEQLTRLADTDDDTRVRATALAALTRVAADSIATFETWQRALRDTDAVVRRRATEVAPRVGPSTAAALIPALADREPLVAEGAAWALGELEDVARVAGAVPALASTATGHGDALVREAAVAALGAIGDPAGLPAILHACNDKPAIRRRAVLALAPFDGPEVDAAVAKARTDRDWQVRLAADTISS